MMDKEFPINSTPVGDGRPCFIIAEAGVNHNGKLSLALKLVDAAKKAGADAVKFQTFVAEKLASPLADKAQYQKNNDARHSSQLEMLKSLELKRGDYAKLKSHCEKLGIIFLSSPFDMKSFELLQKLDIAAYKIPSGEITNLQLLRAAARSGKPVILSTGMSDMNEVKSAVAFLKSNGCKQLALLHCTSEYPAPPESLNLNVITTMREHFNIPIGYSDHSEGINASVLASCMGACIIEKHFTLDKKMQGPDHIASLEPNELAQLIGEIRNLEAKGASLPAQIVELKSKFSHMLGGAAKRPGMSELATKQLVRKSIFAAREIKQGSPIRENDLVCQRPMVPGALLSEDIYGLVGKKARKEIKAGMPIMQSDID